MSRLKTGRVGTTGCITLMGGVGIGRACPERTPHAARRPRTSATVTVCMVRCDQPYRDRARRDLYQWEKESKRQGQKQGRTNREYKDEPTRRGVCVV